MENSSFIVSSAFPDERLHGGRFCGEKRLNRGVYQHLALLLCLGIDRFIWTREERLCLEFKPVLPAWLFSQKARNGFPGNTFAFKFPE